MKELDLLQDICLEIYGVSLGDISLEAFEHLDAVIWAMSVVRKALLEDTKVFPEPDVLNCTCSCHERGLDICPVNCCNQLNECPVCDNLYESCCDNCGFEEGLGERQSSYCDICQCPEDSDCRIPLKEAIAEVTKIIECTDCGHKFEPYKCPVCGYEKERFEKIMADDNRGNKPQQRYYCEKCDLKLGNYGDTCDNCGYDNLPF